MAALASDLPNDVFGKQMMLQKDSCCIQLVKKGLTEMQKEHLNLLRQNLEMRASTSIQGRGVLDREILDVGPDMDVLIWCPERTHHNTQMPCPSCGPVDGDVQSLGFRDDSYFLLRTPVRKRELCVVAMEYGCSSCKTKFHGWHPDSLGHMSASVSALFPVPRSLLSIPEFEFLRRIELFEVSVKAEPFSSLNFPNFGGIQDLDLDDVWGDDELLMYDDLDYKNRLGMELNLNDNKSNGGPVPFNRMNSLEMIPMLLGTTPPQPVAENLKGLDEADTTMAVASLSGTKRSIQFCSVCCGIRREHGQLVGGHEPNGFCPIKGRKATADEKRELRRRRQKMRRAMNKRLPR